MIKQTEDVIVSNPKLVKQVRESEGIFTTIRAISADKITRNCTYYPKKELIGNRKDTGYASMVTPYSIPVITNHNALPGWGGSAPDTPMGRIVNARFVEDANGGYVECVAHITDMSSIDLITSNRYLTVSIGAGCESVTCSVCGEEVLGGECSNGHQRGQECRNESGKVSMCYHIVHGIQFQEISFVNVPSDNEARILQVDTTPGNLKHCAKSDEGYKDLISSRVFETVWCDGQNVGKRINKAEEERMEPKEEAISLGKLYSLPEENSDFKEVAMTTEEYNALPASAFCGPHRTYPSHTKEHVLSGLKRVNSSELSETSKSKTMATLFRKGLQHGIGSKESILVVCDPDNRVTDFTREGSTSESIAALVGQFKIEGPELAILRTQLRLESDVDEATFGESGTVGQNPATVAVSYPLFRAISKEEFDAIEASRLAPKEEPKEEMNTTEYYKLLEEYDTLALEVEGLKEELEKAKTVAEEIKAQSEVTTYEKEYTELLLQVASEKAVDAGIMKSLEEAKEKYAGKNVETLQMLIEVSEPIKQTILTEKQIVDNAQEKLDDINDPRPIAPELVRGMSLEEASSQLTVTEDEDLDDDGNPFVYTLILRDGGDRAK